MLRTLKEALELKRLIAAQQLCTTTFVWPSATGSQIFGLLQLTLSLQQTDLSGSTSVSAWMV